jgi:DNA replication protein DnaC
MAKALSAPRDLPESQALRCAERLGLLGARAMTVRRERRRTTRWRQATLRLRASIEASDDRPPRGLAQALRLRLGSCQWVQERSNVLITGPTGIGQTWLACAWGHQACRAGYPGRYLRLPRLLQALPLAPGDGRSPKLMAARAKTAVLILAAWGRAPRHDEHRRDVLERLEDRHGRGAPIVPRQFPGEHWHEALGEPTLAEAILDRLLHNASKSTRRGESMRKRHAVVKHDGPAP